MLLMLEWVVVISVFQEELISMLFSDGIAELLSFGSEIK